MCIKGSLGEVPITIGREAGTLLTKMTLFYKSIICYHYCEELHFRLASIYIYIVWNDDVINPVAVRYAWANNPLRPNLYNKEGLPASPFRTSELY